MKLWQILALVAFGIIYAGFAPGHLTAALGPATLYVFLPPLLFEAAWNLNHRAVVRQWRAIAFLAGPGVLITAAIVAAALAVVRVPLPYALLTGAILAATDPIAVVAVFKRLRVPLTLATIVECESLFNDATAVVLYRAVLMTIATGTSAAAIGWATVSAVAGSIGGIAIGVAVAWSTGRLLRNGRGGVATQIVATVVCSYGCYFAADALHASGIFATIAFGIAIRAFEWHWISLSMTQAVHRFWDYAAIAANALVFFMVGAALRVSDLTRDPAFVLVALVAVGAARYAMPALLAPARFPAAWLNVLRIAGFRSALSLALAISLPGAMPFRSAIIGATFAVALATLVSGSLTIDRVIERAVRR